MKHDLLCAGIKLPGRSHAREAHRAWEGDQGVSIPEYRLCRNLPLLAPSSAPSVTHIPWARDLAGHVGVQMAAQQKTDEREDAVRAAAPPQGDSSALQADLRAAASEAVTIGDPGTSYLAAECQLTQWIFDEYPDGFLENLQAPRCGKGVG